MLRPALLALMLLLSAAGVRAQLVSTVVDADLDGDGTEEVFTLVETGGDYADLSITGTAQGNLYATGIAWTGVMVGQQPELSVAEGAVRVISMNDSVGRDLWKLSLTISYAEGHFAVTGYRYEWRDARNARAFGSCEVDLLSGEGTYSRRNREPRAFQSGQTALPVELWHASEFMPYANCLK